ncbi:MAG: Ig-like domain-containing protein, partial [Gemmatimonadales bacterium]
MTRATSSRPRRLVWPRFAVLAAAVLLGFGGCLDDPSGPNRVGTATLVVQPYFSHSAVDEQFAHYIDAFRITARSLETDAIVLDTTVTFDPGADEVDFVGQIPLVLDVESFEVTITLLSGETALYEGVVVTGLAADPAAAIDPIEIPVGYVGPGRNIMAIAIVPDDTTVTFGDSVRYNVVAHDAEGEVVSEFYVAWRSSDTVLARVNARGDVVAPNLRGAATLWAVTGTGVSDSTPVTFQPLPAALVVEAGDSATGVVGQGVPVAVRVLGDDDLGVRGVPVRFSVTDALNAAVGDTTVWSDSTGLASATVVLSRRIGVHSVRAEVDDTVHGVQLEAELEMIALAGPPAQLVIEEGNEQTGVAGDTLRDPLAVRVFDADSNPVAGQAVNFVVVSGGGSVYGGFNTTNDSGVAKELWILGTSIAEEQRLEARAVDNETGEPLLFDVFTATVVAGDAASLTVESGDAQAGSVGSPLDDSLVVRISDEYGNPVSDLEVEWSTADGGSLTASSVTDGDGVAGAAWSLGTVAGSQTATATAGTDLAAELTATALAGPVVALEVVAGDDQSGTVGETLSDTLVVRASDEYDNPVPDLELVWSILAGDGLVAPVDDATDADGQAHALWTLGTVAGANGLEVHAADDAFVVEFDAEARPGPAAALAVAQSPADATAGDTLGPLVVHVVDAYGNHVTDATPSIDVSLADGAGGLLGTTTVTATAGSASFADLQITAAGPTFQLLVTADGLESATSEPFAVAPGPPAALTIDAPVTTFSSLGDEIQVSVTVADAYGNPIQDQEAVWSTSDDAVITVTADGLVTSVDNGTAAVLAAVSGITAEVEFVVQQVVTAVTVDQVDLLFRTIGAQIQVSAAAEDANGFPVSDATITWTSEDESIATVSSTGLITAVSAGETVVYASSGGFSAAVAVTVRQAVAEVVVTPDAATIPSLDGTVQLSAAAFDASGTAITDVAVVWGSADVAVVKVDETGLVTAVGNGTTEVLATVEGVSGSATVTVEQVVVAVAVSPATATLTSLGETVQLAASATDANGNAVAGTATWASSDDAVATVSPSGLVTAVGNGTAEVTATMGGVSGTATVTVEQVVAAIDVELSASDPPPASDPDESTISFDALGVTAEAVATPTDENGNPVNATIEWESADLSVATVDAAGTITATGNGTTTVTASAGEVIATVTVTVEQAVAAVELDVTSLSMDIVGGTAQIGATVLDRNGNPVVGAAVAWTSSDPSVVTVDEMGIVTAVANGSATITAAANGVSGAATVTVKQV